MSRVLNVKQLEKEPGAIATIDKFKDVSAPEYTGPGTWNVIHRTSFKAQVPSLQQEFIKMMNLICEGFPCKVCSGHCTEYIRNNPMKDYTNMIIEIDGKNINLGLFIWGWKFHNCVNKRINKPIMSWDTAYKLYSGEESEESLVCSKTCTDAKK